MAVIPVPLTLLTGVGAMRLTVPQDLRGSDARQAMLLMLRVRAQQLVGGASCGSMSLSSSGG